jgi:hypothetical protein
MHNITGALAPVFFTRGTSFMAKKSQSDQKINRDRQLLKIIQILREDEKTELDPEEIRRLNASLGQHLSRAKQPEHRDEAIRKAVARIDEYPPIQRQFSEILDRTVKWYSKPEATSFASLSGDLFDIDPGKLMVCPVDPLHYQRYRRNAQQKPKCPHHKTLLTPAEDLAHFHENLQE